MTIRYEPKKILKRLAKKRNVERLLTKKLTVNQAALNAVENAGVVGREELEEAALKVVKEYRQKAKALRKAGASEAEIQREIVDDPRLLVQRIQQATVHEVTQQIKEKYRGEYYTWLPSTAEVPDKKHMKKYGKRFQLGRGEAPGDRYGCKCGMEIHVKESRLKLG